MSAIVNTVGMMTSLCAGVCVYIYLCVLGIICIYISLPIAYAMSHILYII